MITTSILSIAMIGLVVYDLSPIAWVAVTSYLREAIQLTSVNSNNNKKKYV